MKGEPIKPGSSEKLPCKKNLPIVRTMVQSLPQRPHCHYSCSIQTSFLRRRLGDLL